jgi:hypothetical protein
MDGALWVGTYNGTQNFNALYTTRLKNTSYFALFSLV